MAKFDRPKNSIESYSDLKVGDHIWEVCGIWRPFVGYERIVTRSPIKFSEHPEYSEYSTQGDLIVFDISYANDPSLIIHWFASDCNMQPGQSHNDNYWFRSAEDAEAARDFLKSEWEKDPEVFAREIEEQERSREFDRIMDDEMDRHHSYADNNH